MLKPLGPDFILLIIGDLVERFPSASQPLRTSAVPPPSSTSLRSRERASRRVGSRSRSPVGRVQKPSTPAAVARHRVRCRNRPEGTGGPGWLGPRLDPGQRQEADRSPSALPPNQYFATHDHPRRSGVSLGGAREGLSPAPFLWMPLHADQRDSYRGSLRSSRGSIGSAN